jgi:ATF/CREB family transcription factor
MPDADSKAAALKCRQRKKAWLAQLQAKVEYLSNENERLTSALVASREEISRLSTLVGGAGVVGAVPIGVSVNGVGVGVAGPGVQPVSMNVSLPGKGGSSAAVASVGAGQGGRGNGGYGY